ncbi:3-phosphoserine/phosphohydroxythreonine transaminase [Flavobacteriaceae bacterium XHP0103]|uniref:3-phosphoserine/phosphohydroxythreonine transaminase n=1 Tax=Marixanthotalea marina TaxID=2844359 RepID=UPI002989A3AE|nr:3-phosphoserine/phosphohydroxythreonine transaminase [Marixanthotalea marina]MBU3820772.1 3-phosphoserine/phosphohydroxythreonine transaminase [Marixanthotalea marina]
MSNPIQHNFSPGPAVLPKAVFDQGAQALVNYNESGLSIAEISHRSPIFESLLEEATQLIKDLYKIPSHFEVIWVPGGASSQLAIAPMNLLKEDESMAFIDSGYWAKKAIAATNEIRVVEVLASSKENQYKKLPELRVTECLSRYLHLSSNETIEGLQYSEYPDIGKPLVLDMTSDFLTRDIPFNRVALAFASAQKNFGIAGITCVLVNTNYLRDEKDLNIPSIFNYRTHITNKSLYHTLPTFPLYMTLLSLRWIKNNGGIKQMQAKAKERSTLLYKVIDEHPKLTSVTLENRSRMNVCFKTNTANEEEQLKNLFKKNNITGINGFPTIGGFRASMYNFMPIESVELLCKTLNEF